MKLPQIDLSGLTAPLPIVQGAMGIGVSGSGLAAAVANEGGIGMLSGVNVGYREPDFSDHTFAANRRALIGEIRRAKQLAPGKRIGLNLLVAMNQYQELARTAVEEGIELIVSGAGLPLKLPGLTKDSGTRIAPIVSSGKAAEVILKYWQTHFGTTADMIVVEGTEAGGHLGYSREVLQSPDRPMLLDTVREVIRAAEPFRDRFGKPIPVIAAGGIFTGSDLADCILAGAGGVQMATRFVATEECDADLAYKEAYVHAKKEDIVLVSSPVGMPGRALNNSFVRKVAEHGDEIRGCFHCLKGCNPKTAPYCISKALIRAVTGRVEEGLIFVGSSAYRIEKIVPVRELIAELRSEAESVLARC
jgi:NAD(P)H-dependent flavin oxidoreductase YrpB (nitropropane dioxygenase family)